MSGALQQSASRRHLDADCHSPAKGTYVRLPQPSGVTHVRSKSLAKERNLDVRGMDSGEAFRSFYNSDRCGS